MQKDAFRRSPLRYFGLAYEIAIAGFPYTSFRAIPLAMAFRNTYIAMDMVDKAFPRSVQYGFFSGLGTACDVMLWQVLASVIFPGFAMRSIRLFIYRFVFMPPSPQLLSLATIPIIVPPIDAATDLFMDVTYRQMFGKSY